MAFALWVVGAYVFIVYFGTLALQLLIVLVQVAWIVTRWLLMVLFGLLGLVALAFIDRPEARRTLRNEAAHIKVRTAIANGR